MELKQSAQEYEIPHQLAYYECNELGHPTLSMVMSMLMVVADKQSDQLGLSQKIFRRLVEPGLLLVLKERLTCNH